MENEDITPTPAGANASTWRKRGNALLAAGKALECIPYYQEALRLQPELVEVHNLLGVAFRRLNNEAKAVDCFRNAIRIDPAFVAAYNNLGNALLVQGRLQEAVDAFDHALKLQPDNADVVFNLGVALEVQGELTRAVDCYRQVLRMKPGNVLARNHLADALKELGLVAEAIDELRETVQLYPGNVSAYAKLANFAAEGFYQIQPNEIGQIKAFLKSGSGSASDRAFCYFAMGMVHDKLGSYDEAFGYFQLGNDLRKRFLQERKVPFDAEIHHAFVATVMATYSQSRVETVKDWGLPNDLPIFIIGMPRSGTTLVEQVLASHPSVFGAGERENILDFIAQRPTARNVEHYSAALPTDMGMARKMAGAYLDHLATLGQGAARVTIKTNENYLHLGLIATLFPRARIIHCRRDPLDVCLSCYFQNFNSNDFVWSLEDLGAYYRAYEKIMAHWHQVLPFAIYELPYEDLVRDQETVTRNLLAFCGLNWDDRCLTFHNTRRAVRTASVIQVRKPIYDRAIGRWKHYRAHLGPLFQALGRTGMHDPGERGTPSALEALHRSESRVGHAP
jgi:tetratricopeptide (TPR) repeat protein